MVNSLEGKGGWKHEERNEEKSWERKRPFSFFFDFGTSQALADVEEEAITTISQQMMEDIFNAAFTDW